MGQQAGTIAGEAVQPGSLELGDGTLPQRYSQKTPGIGDSFTGELVGQQKLEMTGADGSKLGSGEPGSAEPFIEMFNQDVGDLANAQVGNYRRQETAPGAENNSYSDHSSSDFIPLDWTQVVSKKGETRTEHINRHCIEMPERKRHGVFNGDPVEMTEYAWRHRGLAEPVDDGTGCEIYQIPYKNAGYESGYLNTGEELDFITIIVVKGTCNIITAFPSDGR